MFAVLLHLKGISGSRTERKTFPRCGSNWRLSVFYCEGSSFLCFYQVHHHVHRADFNGVDPVDKLLNLLKGGPVGGVMGAAPANQLQRDERVKNRKRGRGRGEFL